MTGTGTVRLELLGRTTVIGPDGLRVEIRRSQVAATIALLWIERRPVRREEIAELLWGDWNLPRHWAGAVRGVLAKLRQVLDDAGFSEGSLRSAGGLIHLDLPDDASTDLDEADTLLARIPAASRAGNHDEACADARRVLELLSQPIAIDTEGEWVRRIRVRVETSTGRARRLRIEALLAANRLGEGLAAAVEAVEVDPVDEVASGLLINAQLAAGRPAAAQRAFANLAIALERELGVAPSPHLAELVADLGIRPDRPADRTLDDAAPGPASVGAFLGRTAELAELRRLQADTVATGGAAFALITGPAGIGKTRLLAEFTGGVDATVLWGRCHLDAGEPYEPFADAFRALAAREPLAWQTLGASTRTTIEALFTASASTKLSGVRATRTAIIRQSIQTIATLCATGPVVLVLDDLHWAAGDTLALAARILEDVRGPLFVVAAARDEVTNPAPLSELLRAAASTVVELSAMSRADLQPMSDDLCSLAEPAMDPDEFTARLWERTGGLPYYVSELERDARRRNRFEIDAVPDQVRAWVRHRVEALSDEETALAELAAVIGPRPSVDLIEACWHGKDSTALPGLERLIRSGFLVETERPDTLTFAHEITRNVIEGGIGATRRARLHARIAEQLTASVDHSDAPHAQIAYHLARSGPQYRRPAARRAYFAGVDSVARGAWDLADDQFTTALDVLDDESDPLCPAILIAHGWTRHARGHAAEAATMLDQAIGLAIEQRLPHEVARGVLFLVGRGGRGAAYGMVDEERVNRLRAALDAARDWEIPLLDHGTPTFPVDDETLVTLQIILEVELAWALLLTGSFDERVSLLDDALTRARAEPSVPGRLGRALLAQRNILTEPGRSDERLATLDEVVGLPAGQVVDEVLINAHLARHEELLMRGDRDGARTALDEAWVVVARYAHPYWRWAAATWESLWLVVNGDPDAAERALADAVHSSPVGSPEAAACRAVQMVAIRLAQGRASEMVESVSASAVAFPHIPAYRAVAALTAALAGDHDRAEAAYRTFAADHFTGIPIDSNRLLTVAVLGDVAATLDDAEGAATLDGMLVGDDALMVVLNCYGGGGSWWGPVPRIRARLADTMGDRQAAASARRRARAMLDRLGAAALGQPGP